MIWLLAVGYHREGQADDAYAHFERLQAAGRLLPDRDDMLAFARSQAPTLARSLLNAVPGLVAGARGTPGVVHSGVIGGRIRVRRLRDRRSAMLTVAISQRLFPGEMQVPADWLGLVRVAASSSRTRRQRGSQSRSISVVSSLCRTRSPSANSSGRRRLPTIHLCESP